LELSIEQLLVLQAAGHLLVTGGPGSGKTTISILKAAQVISNDLKAEQRVLFLSFARATVSRVVEAIQSEQNITVTQRKKVEVETYHSFFWSVIQSHGYLIGLPRRLSIVTPSNEAILLSDIRSNFYGRNLNDEQQAKKISLEHNERIRLAIEEGKICFCLFADFAKDIINNSDRIRNLIATMFPVIILDEFQDTNKAQWDVIRSLGKACRLIVLADPDQRIYDFIGADPERLTHFNNDFHPTTVNLHTRNYRSAGTDIGIFGNDILKGIYQSSEYKGVAIDLFPSSSDQAMTKLITTVYHVRNRLIKQNLKDWSLAILVPTKKMTRLVSDALRQPPAGLTEVYHSAAIDLEAAILGAEIIAFLLQPDIIGNHLDRFIDLLCGYYQGKGGDGPTRTALSEAANIRKTYEEFRLHQRTGKTLRKNSKFHNTHKVYDQTRELEFTGNPDKDWQTVKHVLATGSCTRLNEIAEEVKNIRILERGDQLRQALFQDWRDNGKYLNSLHLTQQAYLREHFSTNAKPETGVIVMNMHKAKGKQFDEVIIFEGWPRYKGQIIVANPDRIVRRNDRTELNDQARQNFRVSVTRGKRNVTILTPESDPCLLLMQ